MPQICEGIVVTHTVTANTSLNPTKMVKDGNNIAIRIPGKQTSVSQNGKNLPSPSYVLAYFAANAPGSEDATIAAINTYYDNIFNSGITSGVVEYRANVIAQESMRIEVQDANSVLQEITAGLLDLHSSAKVIIDAEPDSMNVLAANPDPILQGLLVVGFALVYNFNERTQAEKIAAQITQAIGLPLS